MTIAVDLGRKATKQTKSSDMSVLCLVYEKIVCLFYQTTVIYHYFSSLTLGRGACVYFLLDLLYLNIVTFFLKEYMYFMLLKRRFVYIVR